MTANHAFYIYNLQVGYSLAYVGFLPFEFLTLRWIPGSVLGADFKKKGNGKIWVADLTLRV
jgi:hypothetical protein